MAAVPNTRDTRDTPSPRDEFEVAYYTKELGRSLQRKMLQRRLDDLADPGTAASHHVEEQRTGSPGTPREDRAG